MGSWRISTLKSIRVIAFIDLTVAVVFAIYRGVCLSILLGKIPTKSDRELTGTSIRTNTAAGSVNRHHGGNHSVRVDDGQSLNDGTYTRYYAVLLITGIVITFAAEVFLFLLLNSGAPMDKKELLFGSLPHPMTNEDRHNAWKEITEKAKSLGLVNAVKSWEYMRDVTWANWKRRTLEKRDNKKKTGKGGGKSAQYTEIDNLVLDIIGKESPLLVGLPVPESMQSVEVVFELPSLSNTPEKENPNPVASTSTTAAVELNPPTKQKPAPKVMFQLPAKDQTVKNVPVAPNESAKIEEVSRTVTGKPKYVTKRRLDNDSGDLSAKKAQLQVDLMEIDKRTKSIQLYKLEKKYGLPPSEFTREFHDLIKDVEED